MPVSETELKIALGSTTLKAGEITELKVTLKPGKYVLYCSVPGHEAAGMKLSITVS